MRIVTFNIQHGRSPMGAVDTAALARFCAGLGADVLALQEVDLHLRRSGRVDQAALVARGAAMTGVFGAARRLGLWARYGNALLVRGAVHDADNVGLPRGVRREPRAALVATVEVGGRRLAVAATHLSTDRHDGVAQLDVVLAALGRRPAPRLVLGDLNLRPERAVPALERAGYVVAPTADPTYPASGPFLRIDHVAVQGLEVERVTVLDAAPVSDHRPLLVEVR
jgi:endonuclease/exonuclease/phosphatase family metal-dependent hydrolase